MNGKTEGREQRFHVLTIAVAVLVVYVSALHAGYLPIDDGGILQSIQSGAISVSDIFLKGGKEYYRPVATLSLLGDFHLFGGKTAGYHIGNILFHLLNALLVYRLAKLYCKEVQSAGFHAFFAGLLFAVHPVNSETVVWISCRPDLLCCFFTLLCLIMVIKAESGCRPVAWTGIFLFFLLSLLAKEASLFLPIAVACRILFKRKTVGPRNSIAILSAMAVSGFAYLLMRRGFPLVTVPLQAVSPPSGDVSGMTALDAIAAFGFYCKKLFFPFPLHFTITHINSTLYAVVALLFFSVALFLWKKDLALRFPIAFLAASLAPPIGAMLLLPLWTPYAERYLYLPSVAFSLCAVVALARIDGRIPRVLLVSCLVAFALPTAFRVRLWTKPLLFWQETVARTPNFATSRLVLASEYLKAGHYQKADENLRRAIHLGLQRKERESYREIRKQLEEKVGDTIVIPAKTGISETTQDASLVQ